MLGARTAQLLQRQRQRAAALAPAAAAQLWRHAAGAQQQSASHSSSTSSSGGGGSPGLFGIQRLHAPRDFPRWAQDAKERCGELVSQALSAPPDATVVRLVDDISDELCQVYDSAECCRNVHSDTQWQAAASQACQVLGDFLAEINHHQGLYAKLVEVQEAHARSAAAAAAAAAGGGGGATELAGQQQQQQQQQQRQGGLLSREQLAAFCPETLVVASRYRHDFEKFGIHLADGGARGEVARLLALNQHFPAKFNAALADHKQLGVAKVPSRLLPGSWAAHASLGGRVPVPLDGGTLHHFLSTVDGEEARRQVYLEGGRTPAANLQLLDGMLSCRHQLARLLGFPSYAAFKAADSTLAGSPAAAQSFLEDLAGGVRPHADAELAQLAALKRAHTGDAGAVLQPWDQDFYSRKLAAAQPQHGAAAAAAPYLQLGSVLEGLGELLQRLMGLTLQLQPLGNGESWAPGLLKCAVVCRDLGPLGVVYLDLLSRPGKVPSSGILYPLRCGRELPGGGYQQPVLCLVGNLAASSGGRGGGATTELLLSWREFRTLLHEMGHVVHSVVSRTRYQHVWGTRCSQDIVEVPSHLWEHFATHPDSLSLLVRHRTSREPLPEGLMRQLVRGVGSATPALELQQQALLSLVDLVYHGPQMPTEAGGTSVVWFDMARQHASLPPHQGTSPQVRFGHLTIYGASYYSYLYARCLSEAIWDKHLAGDPLDPAAGHNIRKLLLEPGGSIEPLDILTATLGGVDGRGLVLRKQREGWCPNPQALLNRLRPV